MLQDSRFQLIAGHPALDLVNTVDWRWDPERRKDLLDGFEDLVGWARQSVALGERLPEIPDFALDMHTRRGQEMGRDYRHFIEEASRVEPQSKAADRTWRDWIRQALEKGKLA